MAIKIKTGLIKVFIILLIVSQIKSYDAFMQPMLTISSYQPVNTKKIYVNQGTVLDIKLKHVDWGTLDMSIISPSGVMMTSYLLTNGSTYTWTATQTSDYYIKLISNSPIAPSYHLQFSLNGNPQFPHYGTVSDTEGCLKARMYTRNQCQIQIDQSSYLSRTTTIDYVLQGATSGVQKLSVGPGEMKNLTLNNTQATGFYLIKSCGLYNQEYSFQIYHKYDRTCNFTVPVCGNAYIEYPQECDSFINQGCMNCIIEPGFTCIPSPQNGNANACFNCGDGIYQLGQQCDTGNQTGCTNCLIDVGFNCYYISGPGSHCQPICGDRIIVTGEQCDNGNLTGCFNCTVNLGYQCSFVGGTSACNAVCGDGILVVGQSCDNGNQTGCVNCVVMTGYQCLPSGAGSTCNSVCGDGILVSGQSCDNGNQPGCTNCSVATGYTCGLFAGRSACNPICGDGILVVGEQCDNGNQTGCDSCYVAPGYICSPQGAGSDCIFNSSNPAPVAPVVPGRQDSSPEDNTVRIQKMRKLENSMEILLPVSFVILVLLVVILSYNSIKQFKNLRSKEVDMTNPDTSDMKKLSGKNFQNQQMVQAKPNQL